MVIMIMAGSPAEGKLGPWELDLYLLCRRIQGLGRFQLDYKIKMEYVVTFMTCINLVISIHFEFPKSLKLASGFFQV